MELENMKTAWRDLDGRLGKQEMFSENFVRESIAEKSQRSVDKLLRFTIWGAVITALAIPYLLWWNSSMPDDFSPLFGLFFQFVLVIAVVGFSVCLINAWLLFRMDISGKVRNNIKLIKRYKLNLQYEYRVIYWVFIPVAFVGSAVLYAKIGAVPWMWAFLIGIYVSVVVLCIYMQKKVFAKHIGQITRGLEELRDLKEGEEE